MSYTYDERVISDLHKDARGFRPPEYFWEEWTRATADIKQQIWNNLCSELSLEIKRERQAQARAALALTERLGQMYELGAKSEVQALQWIMEAEEFDDYDLQYGPSYFCYHFGLSSSATNDFRIQEAMNEMLAEVA